MVFEMRSELQGENYPRTGGRDPLDRLKGTIIGFKAKREGSSLRPENTAGSKVRLLQVREDSQDLLCHCKKFWVHVECFVLFCFSDQGSNPGPLHWEPGLLATGPWGKALVLLKRSASCMQYSPPLSHIRMGHETSLVVQWIGICLPMQGTRVLPLVLEDLTCCGTTEPLSHNCWSPPALEFMLCNKRCHYKKNPAHRSEE